jgi:Tol biopolymer transport system component
MAMMAGWYLRLAGWVSMLMIVVTLLTRVFDIPTREVTFMSANPKYSGIAIMDINRPLITTYMPQAIIGYQTDFAWSPDASVIVFRVVTDITIDLYVSDMQSSLFRRVTGTGKNNHSPSFSPDGRWLAFTSERDGNPEIYVTDATCLQSTAPCKDSDAHRLTNNTFTDDQAAWSPDNQQIVFQSNRDGDFEIYSMNIDGNQQRRLTNSPQRDLMPDWSPDGTKIVFISERDINNELYLMKADGSDQRRLTTTPEFEFSPQWSPDGQQILFQRTVAGSDFETFVMQADGSHAQRLTTVQMFLQNPAWHS